jgi:uncharacterized protein YfaA (DUF2138 family)
MHHLTNMRHLTTPHQHAPPLLHYMKNFVEAYLIGRLSENANRVQKFEHALDRAQKFACWRGEQFFVTNLFLGQREKTARIAINRKGIQHHHNPPTLA